MDRAERPYHIVFDNCLSVRCGDENIKNILMQDEKNR